MFEALLAERDWLLADGAMATNLFEMGLAIGVAPETWLTLHPERITALHRRFVEAGSDIILTNTFGCNRRRLALHGLQSEARRLNAIAVGLARDAVKGAGRVVVIAGCVGPTGDRVAPHGPLTQAEAVAVFVEQMEGLKAGGADVVWIETMSALAEMRAAAEAARCVGLPYVLTASFDTAGGTLAGLAPGEFAQAMCAFDPPPLAIGANCGVGPPELIPSIQALTAAAPNAIIMAKANCGLPQMNGGRLDYGVTAEMMQDYARLARNAGARIIGGCCGTTPAHIKAMRRALEDRPKA